MRFVWKFILVLSLIYYTGNGLLQAQQSDFARIEGRVINSQNGEPLQSAHVFLSGTKIGTVTNSAGYFRLREVPPGLHRLVVSIVGYDRIVNELSVAPREQLNESLELTPAVYEMNEVYVGNLDERWESHLERFKRLFLGESQMADSVTILNPEVLRFQSRWWGRFTAEALGPIRIENRALGYHITYYLDEFFHNGIRTRWDGEPLFTEMTPADDFQAAYWSENRKKAFAGSLRHFLISVVQDSVEHAGFKVYHMQRNIQGFSPSRSMPTSTQRFVRPADEPNLYHLRFWGRLQIVYTEAGEDPRYVDWLRDEYRAPSSIQTSWMELNEHPVTIDADGEMLEPYGSTQFGYHAFTRLAEATPREFRPVDVE